MMLHKGRGQEDTRAWGALRKSILANPAEATSWQSDSNRYLNPFHMDFFMRQRLSFHRDLLLRQRVRLLQEVILTE
jgi:hypothetical protein